MLHEKGGNASCGTKKSKSKVKKGGLWKNPLSIPETKKVKYGGWTVLELPSDGLLGPNARLAPLRQMGSLKLIPETMEFP